METPDPSVLQDALDALRLVPFDESRRSARGAHPDGAETRPIPWLSRDADTRPVRPFALRWNLDLPLITIIIPSYGQGEFIERTLRSVLTQGYPRLEVLVVDGGSTDATVAILEGYRERYPDALEFVSEPDRGQAHAVNKGFELARGEIVGWLNSDDTYQPGCLYRVARAFQENARCDLVYGHAWYIGEDDRLLAPYPSRREFDWRELVHECYICQPTTFWRRRVLERGYRLDEGLQLCMDYDFWIRLGREFEIRFLDRHLANSRLHDAAKTLRLRPRIFEEVFTTVRRHYGFIPISWAMGKAHHIVDRADPFFNTKHPTWKTYLMAVLYLVRHNWAAPHSWPRLLREGAGLARRKLRRKLRELLAAALRKTSADQGASA